MDEYTGFARWGLLWVLLGVALWVLLTRGHHQTEATQLPHPNEPPPVAPRMRKVSDPTTLASDALRAVDDTYAARAAVITAELRPHFYLFVLALVTAAHRIELATTLTEQERATFCNAMWAGGLAQFADRFGDLTPTDEDDFDPELYLAEVMDDCLDIWTEFAVRNVEGEPERAFRTALRKSFYESLDADFVKALTAAAVAVSRTLEQLD